MVSPGEFRPVTSVDDAPEILRHNADISVSSRNKLIRWQEWYRVQQSKAPQ